MKIFYKILRTLLVMIIALVLVVPALIYVVASLPSVQQGLCRVAQRELTTLLGMDVHINEVAIAPFNRVTIRRLSIIDEKGDTAIGAYRIGAGINLASLVLKQRIVIDYTELIGLNIRLKRDSLGGPLNIQPLLDALGPKDPNRDPSRYDLRINTVMMRRSSLSYDVENMPEDSSRFDRNHIKLTDLRADLQLPALKNDAIEARLRRFAFSEQSGITVENIRGDLLLTDSKMDINNLYIGVNHSKMLFDDLDYEFGSRDSLSAVWHEVPIHVRIKDGSYVVLSDFKPFLPSLGAIDAALALRLDVSGSLRSLDIDTLQMRGFTFSDDDLSCDPLDLTVNVKGRMTDVVSSERQFDIERIEIATDGSQLGNIIGKLSRPNPTVTTILSNSGSINVLGSMHGTLEKGSFQSLLSTDPGTIELTGEYNKRNSVTRLSSQLDVVDMKLDEMLANTPQSALGIGAVDITTTLTTTIDRDRIKDLRVEIDANEIEYKGWQMRDITLVAECQRNRGGEQVTLMLNSDNPGLDMWLNGSYSMEASTGYREVSVGAQCNELMPQILGVKSQMGSRHWAFALSGHAEGLDVNRMEALLDVNNIEVSPTAELPGINFHDIKIKVGGDTLKSHLEIESDILKGKAVGHIDYLTLGREVMGILRPIFPALMPQQNLVKERTWTNDFDFAFTVNNTEKLSELVKLPVSVIDKVSINGRVDVPSQTLQINVDAPYLQMGNKLIEQSSLFAKATNNNDSVGYGEVLIKTQYPTKKGEMDLSAMLYATDNKLDTKLDWRVNRDRDFKGTLDLTTTFGRSGNELTTEVYFNPSELVFNDTIWQIDPAVVNIEKGRIEISDIRVGRQNQYVSIKGIASAEAGDSLTLRLQDVNLDYIFETLDIGTAMFGGNATGTFYATNVLGEVPVLYTPLLSVKGLSYNHSLMGDTDIRSAWDNESKAITINAEISQPNGRKSLIDGAIMPFSESLDFNFDADKIEIGFMRPFMEAFTSEVGGYASGKARLWGTFKYIDMVGDIYAEDVFLKLDFTNTYYWATDSVHLTPGHILLDDITLRDVYGNKAKLNGWLTHEFFKKPRFDFNITDADDMLVYDVKENIETNWYGRIFGDGSARVTGEPGLVNINVNMTTAPHSSFTFVLNDAEEAYDYNFITFRDRDQARKDSLNALNALPQRVRELKEQMAQQGDNGGGSVYKMNVAVNVTPDAAVVLVLDPVGGDRIRAFGSGPLRMTYDSSNEDLRMFGTYTLQRGSYNFTLQDIIIKDFTIDEGSSITFNGDPFAAVLDIKAVYQLNANLSDLDDSFLEDKELTRTNVPVQAQLDVTGDMRQPDISFDLRFPTLSQDVYRKVKSIVSTEEMMNRQIIYLLALNRFYTPDYMSATKGNELVSVASSTISSQLGNMLGQLSDNWSISPNFRSDRGDFSDVEVDLALSSHLLNNRLLFNGNFGYRDKTMNNNTFIGDFDIEYLLSRSGTMRLKAYNRYNDQNYYLKSALTTQGVGVVWKRDFDNLLGFLNIFKRKKRADSDK